MKPPNLNATSRRHGSRQTHRPRRNGSDPRQLRAEHALAACRKTSIEVIPSEVKVEKRAERSRGIPWKVRARWLQKLVFACFGSCSLFDGVPRLRAAPPSPAAALRSE